MERLWDVLEKELAKRALTDRLIFALVDAALGLER
jgi:hypothetical protein